MGNRLPRKDWRTLWRDRSGATALITGLAFLLIACAAMTIYDLSNTNSQKAKLQDIVDAATLAAAKVGGDDDAAAIKAGEDYLKAHLPAGLYQNLDVKFIPGEKTVRATATAGIDPYFLNVFLDGPVEIALDSEVVRQVDGSLEVALVLDVTGSMGGTKIQALKDAADALVKKITKVKDADVRIGVVPFSNYVNVGLGRRNEPWISGSADVVKTTKKEAGCNPDIKQSTKCVKYAPSYTCTKYNDGVPYQTTCPGSCVQSQTEYYDPPKKGSCWPESTTTTTTKWTGCVGSPAYPGNVQDKTSNIYPAKFENCAPELTPLTDKLGPVESAIKSLNASGYTYIPAGLAWGWNLLSPTEPLSQAAAYDPKNKKPRKALVLMSDGANTMSVDGTGRHNYVGDGKPAPQADKYTAELCENIKKQKIEVYTVAFQIDIPAAHEMLAKCATSQGHYFKADSPEELISAFAAIGASLENLRISH